MTYRTSNVARFAGATSLLAVLGVWGLLSLVVAGETTVTTWALGLAAMFPASALAVAVALARRPPRTGLPYALGVVGSVVVLSVAYLGVAAIDYGLLRAVAAVTPLGLVAATVGFGLLGAGLVVVDRWYVERPVTAAVLERRHLDEPVRGD